MLGPEQHHRLHTEGWVMLPNVLAAETSEAISECLQGLLVGPPGGRQLAVRAVLAKVKGLAPLLFSDPLRQALDAVYGGPCWFVSRSVYIHKPVGQAWMLPPHQSTTISVSHRAEVPGFGPWTVKSGIVSVQPNAEILERGLALRFQLDDALAANGALRVWPRSHLSGKFSVAQIEHWTRSEPGFVAEAPAGSVLALRPLLVRGPSRPEPDAQQRVLQVDLNSCPLPANLQWAERWMV